ncbi:DUF6328 family protein [Kytococcus sedentarius]|uniref:DUF6328 family protein n=1 Tax=Kytococcus sedentarius TaxID=1276 RepID=UPI0035BC2773
MTAADPAASRALRDEAPAQQEDRNLAEILQEVRVLQTGTQVLAGFLLTLPFQARFTELTGPQTGLFLTATGLSVLTVLLLITPVAVHRGLFHRQLKGRLIAVSHTLVRVGLVTLGLSVAAMFALIFAIVLGTTAAGVAGGTVAVLALLMWGALPLWLRRPAD